MAEFPSFVLVLEHHMPAQCSLHHPKKRTGILRNQEVNSTGFGCFWMGFKMF